MTVDTTDLNEQTIVFSKNELDIHAYTIAFFDNGKVLSFTDKACDVSPYTDKYDQNKSILVFHAETG